MSPAEGIKQIIEDAALSEVLAASALLMVSELIDGTTVVNSCLAFLDQPGSPPETAVAVDYPSVQVLARGERGTGAYPTTWNMIKAVTDHLHRIQTPDNSGSYPELVSCLASSGIVFLGYDDIHRPLFSTNFRLITNPTNPGNRL